jgi:hypothetical protein
MPDEIQQPNSEPSQPERTPIPTETPISEPISAPVIPSEPTEQPTISPMQSIPSEIPSMAPEATPSSEDAILVKDDISANEPLDTEASPDSNITIENNGNGTPITEVMEPTAQMAGNEPIDLAEEIKIKEREENLKLANETRQEKKREKINKILTLFSEKTQITNDEVEKLLHVSDATATRYLEQLEKEAKIRQVGKTGKHTHYERI